MEYGKTIVALMLVIFLLSITSVCASETDSPLASEDTDQIELSANGEVVKQNLQTDEIKDNDVTDGVDSATYSDLAAEISQPGNINLTHKNYTYDEGATITISEDNKVIDGNGAVIDMNGSTIRAFHVSASGVTIKNLTIKNANYNGNGGAIYFDSTGTVTNCNFTNNSAGKGGAIFSRLWYTTVDTCIFKKNSGDDVNTVIYPPTLNVNNFTTVYGSGDKLTFDLKTNSSIPVTNGNISISVYF